MQACSLCQLQAVGITHVSQGLLLWALAGHVQDSGYKQVAEYKQQIDDLRDALQVGRLGG